MGKAIRDLEDRLCRYFGRKHCILAGRCTAAIYAVLRALEIAPGKVALATISNPAPANAVLYAGLEPIFCDINLNDFNIDIVSLRELIEKQPKIKAIIAVHLFGQPADILEISHLARTRGLYLIEDVAQAMGGKYQGKRLGSFGDVSVVSFAHTKILDVGLGGAALTDDAELAGRVREEVNKLPPIPENFLRMSEEYRKLYYILKPLAETNPRLNELFVPLPDIYKDMYLFKISEEVAIRVLREMDMLDDYVVIRRRNALEYQQILTHPDIIHPLYQEEGVYWRYSFLIKGDRQKEICQSLRQKGIDISNWYPPMHRWYIPGIKQGDEKFNNANYFASHICNLWTDPSQSISRVRTIGKALLELLNGDSRNSE